MKILKLNSPTSIKLTDKIFHAVARTAFGIPDQLSFRNSSTKHIKTYLCQCMWKLEHCKLGAISSLRHGEFIVSHLTQCIINNIFLMGFLVGIFFGGEGGSCVTGCKKSTRISGL